MKATEKKAILEQDFDISMTEKMEGEVEEMCNLSDEVEQKGIEKGLQRGLQSSVRVLRKVGKTDDEILKLIMEEYNLEKEEVLVYL